MSILYLRLLRLASKHTLAFASFCRKSSGNIRFTSQRTQEDSKDGIRHAAMQDAIDCGIRVLDSKDGIRHAAMQDAIDCGIRVLRCAQQPRTVCRDKVARRFTTAMWADSSRTRGSGAV